MSPEYHSPEITPFSPNLLDKTAGFIGRMVGRDSMFMNPEPGTAFNTEILPHDSVMISPELADSITEGLESTVLLEQPHYIPPSIFENSEDVGVIELSEDKPLLLPVRNFVNAPGLTDWNGTNRYKEFNGQTVKSSVVRRKYARLGTQSPPITMAVAYIQPNGTVLFGAQQDGAHRLGAAHTRNNPTEKIAVSQSITLKKLGTNIT